MQFLNFTLIVIVSLVSLGCLGSYSDKANTAVSNMGNSANIIQAPLYPPPLPSPSPTPSPTPKPVSGIYAYEEGYSFGEVQIDDRSGRTVGKSFKFAINVGATGPNPGSMGVGEISGRARWVSDSAGDYEEKFEGGDGALRSCRLTFVFYGDTLTVQQHDDCHQFHGATVQFEGAYKKRAAK